MRETTYWPKLCLIQAAAPGGSRRPSIRWPRNWTSSPLLTVLRDAKILKVFHAARQDVEIFNNLGAMPEPLFDTQIAGDGRGLRRADRL